MKAFIIKIFPCSGKKEHTTNENIELRCRWEKK